MYGYLLENPVNPQNDENLRAIAEYVALGLNAAIAPLGLVAVRDVVTYDRADLDLSRFPLLKIYRISTNFKLGEQAKTRAALSYCLSFANQEELPGLIHWAAVNIDKLLQSYKLQHSGCVLQLEDGYDCEYRIMVNQVNQPVYAFLRFNITIFE